MTGGVGRVASVLVAAAAAGMVAGCASGRGEEVANAIADSGSALIEVVEYRSANPDEVNVFLVPGATGEQAATFWCEVVIPAGARPASDPVVTIRGSEESPQDGGGVLVDGRDSGSLPECPPATPTSAPG